MLFVLAAASLPAICAVQKPELAVPLARSLERRIDLSGASRPVAVLRPQGQEYERAAAVVGQAIAAAGGKAPRIVTAPAPVLPDQFNVVAIGNVNNNPLIARLYWNWYACEDALLPGPGAYTLRTVYDPYPWHGKGDVVVVGVSAADAAGEACRDLAGRIQAGPGPAGLDYTLVVSSAAPVSAAEKRRLAAKPTPSFKQFLDSASRYQKSGREEYARHAVATLDSIVSLYEAKPDHDCDWPEEINSGGILGAWDAFEECPLLPDERRVLYARAFLRLVRRLKRHVSGWSRLGSGDLVAYNHTTYPLLGVYFGARWFRDYYGLPEAETYLAKARACLLAQARSYKPTEDADVYLVLTVGHAIDYCLAEWRTDLLDAGLMRNHADYAIGISDSAGKPAGFGDSGHGGNPKLVKHVLPRAYWWTRDPGYLWVLRHVLGQGWPNPFHSDVTPAPPQGHVGVRVFPMDPQVYELTRRSAYYNEPKTPPNVPLTAAFDKIAFRESWEKDGQYLLLDGFARGKHLHYDGNAIIEFVDRGRRWLWDHDYLTRNTTEHNMLSVIRDGRARELVPSCAGLICAADPGGAVGLVATEVRGYAGIDWRRDVFWRKGEFFVVMDAMTAGQPGEYDLDLAWKCQDCGAEAIADHGKAFTVVRYPVQAESKHLVVVEDAEASGGKAVLFGQNTSSLSFQVDVPGGTYNILLRARGMGSSSDSLFASTNGSERVTCHAPSSGYGPANAKYDFSGRAPRVNFVGDGPHVVTLFMRENPPVRVDRITLVPAADGETTVIEAESAEPPGPDALKSLKADRFVIKWPDPVSPRTVASTPPGIVIPVRKLLQRTRARLDVGDAVETANLLYTDNTGDPLDLSIRRLAPGAVLISGAETALLAKRGARVNGLSFDGEMAYVSPSRVAWAGAGSLALGGKRIAAAAPCDLELDLTTGKSLGAAGKLTAELTSAAVADWLAALAAPGAATRPQPSPRPPGLSPEWTWAAPEPGRVARLRVRDIDADGAPEILVACGFRASAVNTRGETVWSHRIAGMCHDLDAGDLTAAPGLETVVAGGDAYAHMLSSSGAPISKCETRGAAWNQNFGDQPWACVVSLVRDLDGDGAPEIAIGMKSFDLRVYDAAWRLLGLARRAVVHGSTGLAAVDANGDGKLEILLGDRYGSVHLYGCDARNLGSFYTSIGDMQAAAADLDGDGRIEVVGGSSTGDLACYRMTEEGKLPPRPSLWRFDNFGYGVNRLRAADVDGDGRAEVIVASQTGFLYVLAHDGSLKWRDRAGGDIVEVLVLEDGPFRLACFDGDGVLALASGDGKTRRRFDLGMSVRTAVQANTMFVVGGDSRVSAFRADPTR